MIVDVQPLTLDVEQLAIVLGYLDRNGKARRRLIYGLVAAGKIPPAIDNSIPKVQWRWSRAEVTDYAARTERQAS